MTAQEMIEQLRSEGLKPDAVSLPNQEPRENTRCLREEGNSWVLFYFERGERWPIGEFKSEDEACRFLLDELRRDPVARLSWSERPIPPESVQSLPKDDPRRVIDKS